MEKKDSSRRKQLGVREIDIDHYKISCLTHAPCDWSVTVSSSGYANTHAYDVKVLFLVLFYLRNRKHFPCFDTVTEAPVEV